MIVLMLAVGQEANFAVWAWNVSVHVEMMDYKKGCRVTHRLYLDVTRTVLPPTVPKPAEGGAD